MDQRFVRAWARIEARRDSGEDFNAVLEDTPAQNLVAALAAAGRDDPVAANVIATELLNRLNRAPFLGAAIVSASTILLLFTLEWVYTGTPFVVEEASPRAYVLIAFSAVVVGVSVCATSMWRGRLPRVRAWFTRVGRRGF